MTNNNSLFISFIAFTWGAIIVYAVWTRWKAYAARQAEREKNQADRREATASAMLTLAKALEDSSRNGIDSVKLLAGTLKACESIAQATVELKDAVKAFQKLVGGGAAGTSPNGYPADNLATPTDEEASRTATFIDAILRGIPADQAQQQADEASEKKTMLSAISLGPGEDEN